MNNPWLNIPFGDYEKHMSDKNVGQLQVLSEITRIILELHKPERFVLLGCCTGNGLEHVNNLVTRRVYGIDINPEYLEITKKRFGNLIPQLKLICADINTENIPALEADLVFAALIFEYVNTETTVKKISECLKKRGKTIVVIQKNKQNQFVSKTNYSSLLQLASISKEINEYEIIKTFEKHNFKFSGKKNHPLSSGKEFLILEFVKISSS